MGDGTKRDESAAHTYQPDHARRDPAIEYRRLRSPTGHGQCLQVPALIEIDQLWNQNLAIENPKVILADHPLAEVQRIGRAELIERAKRYSRRYTQADFSDRSQSRIIMAGHQPELFHPGVWFKNFVLSRLGSRFGATPINLVVDNDICGKGSIRFPDIEGNKVSLGSLPIVHAGPNVPFEMRAIDDLDFFGSFQDRASKAIRNMVTEPIVNRLWPHVMKAVDLLSTDLGPRLGASIAAGRHRLENEIGLKTLEVPISQISQTTAFAIFLESILLNVSQFRLDYNQSLTDYRTANRIRSRSHPVPELELVEGWYEIPFWIWQSDNPNRRRVFIKPTRNSVILSDRIEWEAELEAKSFVEQFLTLGDQGIAVRPRALMTTMFSRLILSDLFIHGIGGAKYDQLTDVIIKRFFAAQPPGFLTLSATMKLPTEIEIVRRADLVRSSRLVRDLKFHPESHINVPSPDVRDLIQQKRDWTIGQHKNERSKQKHEAITGLNAQLSRHTDVDPDEVLKTRSQQLQQVRAGEILDSREYSFCLFPESLTEELQSLADIQETREK